MGVGVRKAHLPSPNRNLATRAISTGQGERVPDISKTPAVGTELQRTESTSIWRLWTL